MSKEDKKMTVEQFNLIWKEASDIRKEIEKAKDQAALEFDWVDWTSFRAGSDWIDDIVVERAMEIYAQQLLSKKIKDWKVEFTCANCGVSQGDMEIVKKAIDNYQKPEPK